MTLAGPLPGPGEATPAFLPPTGAEIAFAGLGVMALAAGLLVVTTRQLVHAALWLVVTLGSLAGCFLLLTAELVAWVQVLIYIGAVVVLLLFGIMLTRAPIGRSADLDSRNRPAAIVVAGATAVTLITVVAEGFRGAYLDLGGEPAGTAGIIGAGIFRTWVLPFEVLSVLLLSALIGAIVLTRPEIAGAHPDDGSAATGSSADPSGDGRRGPTTGGRS